MTLVVFTCHLIFVAAGTDFIGLSSYAPLPANVTYDSMETSIQTAAFEMLAFGIDLKELLFSKNKSLVYSEQGLGGTTDDCRIPPDLQYIREHPFSGAPPQYSDELDPWQVRDSRSVQRLSGLVKTAFSCQAVGCPMPGLHDTSSSRCWWLPVLAAGCVI